MSSDVDGLFRIEKIRDGYAVMEYLKKDDPSITEIEVPSEFNGRPVTTIENICFGFAKYLREIVIPNSVRHIGRWAFLDCPRLSAVRLPKHVIIEAQAFMHCCKIPAEIVMAELVGSPEDISAPMDHFREGTSYAVSLDWNNILRPDVFELVVKYDSFRETGMYMLYAEIVRNRLFSHFEMLENAGRAPDAAQTNRLIEQSVKNKHTEMTAYLLEYKKRKFGFTGFGEGDNFEL